VSQVGATVTEVPVNHRARQFGRSKYGISRTVRVMLDLITVWFLGTYSTRPIHVFGTLGLASMGVGVLFGLYLTFLKLFRRQHRQPAAAAAGRLLVVIGVQLVTMGLLGEMITRTYYESQDKPIYVVREIVNDFVDEEAGSKAGAFTHFSVKIPRSSKTFSKKTRIPRPIPSARRRATRPFAPPLPHVRQEDLLVAQDVGGIHLQYAT
jgi:hypothetical protein